MADPAPQPTPRVSPYTAPLPGPGKISNDFSGSYQEWRARVIADLIRRYVEGRGGLGSDDPELGRPSEEDYGSGQNGNAGQYSHATVQYWEKFVDKYGATDPFIAGNYGPPPTRNATYIDDPNGNAADRDWRTGENAKDRDLNKAQHDAEMQQQQLDRDERARQAAAELESRRQITEMEQQGENARQTERINADAEENAKQRTWQSGESAVERAWREAEAQRDRDLALERENRETERVRLDITSREKIAAQDDLTRRWQAEGDWGVQKWVEEERNRGALERLELELGVRREEMALDAESERNRHHEAMVGYVLEVAKYDSEMAGQPVNWLKYAAWLNNRGQVVNGMTLAMAASNVPDSAISAQEVAASGLPGSNVAAMQTDQDAQQQQPMTSVDPNSNPAQQTVTANSTPAPAPTPSTSVPANYKGVDLQNRNYEEMLNQILGLNPNAATPGVDNSQANIQATLDMLNTTGHQDTPTQQGAGIDLQGVGQFNFNGQGAQQDYRKFKKLLPSMQQMNVGAAQATGNPVDDYLYGMNKARPKGGSVGVSSYG